MNTLSAGVFGLIALFSAFLALWPLGFAAVFAMHALARRWKRAAQLALLLPLWCVAASLGLVQLPRLIGALDGSLPAARAGTATVALVLSVCIGAVAWALLLRSYRDRADRTM
jgi:hypothetical protein